MMINMKKYMCSLIIVLYGASWCGWCTQQKQALDDAHIAYEYKDVDKVGMPADATGVPYMINTRTGKTHSGYISGSDLGEFAA